MARAVGIDLGTTFSLVATMQGGDPVIIPTSEGERLLPSVVAVSKTGERLVGWLAKRQGVTLNRQYATQGMRVMGDGHELKQVFLNLLLNALQAMPEGGLLSSIAEEWQPGIGSGAARWVQVRICDSGIGIPANDIDKIFDPFFTTKREGTGLGLSVCHGIVHRHEGEIDVASEVGKGTTVSVRLPLI